MIIAIAATGRSKDSCVDSPFGRCRWFCIYDSVKEGLSFVENSAAGMHERPGCEAAGMVVSAGATVAVAGRFGARAAQILRENGIQMVIPLTETRIQDIINKIK